MNKEKIALLIYIFLFITGFSVALRAEYINEPSFDNLKNNELSIHQIDSGKLTNEEFVEQEFNYYAPLSGTIFLVWDIENFPLEESVLWNDNTKLTDGLLYTPMVAYGDTFNLKVKVPMGSRIKYYFWILKNKQGHYQDFWDNQSSGTVTASDTQPIHKNAIYSKAEKKKKLQILSVGWVVLLVLVVVFVVLNWFEKKWHIEIKSPSQIEKVLFLGVSLSIFHALARSEIIGVKFMNISYIPGALAKIIRGSIGDFIFVGSIVIIFALALLVVRNVKVRNFIYGAFVFLALFSTLLAFTNITTVFFLGKPFTFQWLYYSDFLGSNEAKTALQENVSIGVVLNLLGLCLSMLILARILYILHKLISVKKPVMYVTYSLIGLGLILLSVKASLTKDKWTKGQSENAITSMIYSVINANSNSTFFTEEIPADMEPFNPAQATKLKMPFGNIKDHKVENVLFIILESAGAVYFDAYGGKFQLSPNLNKYVDQSLIFDQMYAHAPATNRSLLSLLGSVYPYLSYKSITQEAPDIDFPTISSVLKGKGYRTSFFSSADLNFQNSKQFLAHRGFDCVEDFSKIKCDEEFLLDNNNYKEGNGIDDMCLADRLDDWLDEDTSKNFFSVIWTMQGHYPYFFANEEKDFGVSDYNFNRYLNCMHHNDELIGKVLRNLEHRGLAETTLVVVTGDHGEAFGQHQQYGHGTAIYEENIRVPLYFINPDLFNGERKSDFAGMKDLATTALSIIDIDAPKEWQGRDLLSTDSYEAFFFEPWSDYVFGYRKDNLKFIFNESQNTVQVYDLNSDPFETTNLIQTDMKGDVSNARKRIAAWVQFQDSFINQIREK